MFVSRGVIDALRAMAAAPRPFKKKKGFLKELENNCTHTFVHEDTMKQPTHLITVFGRLNALNYTKLRG